MATSITAAVLDRRRVPILLVVGFAALALPAAGAPARPRHVRDLRVTPRVIAPNGAARISFTAATPENQRRRNRRKYVMHTYQFTVSGGPRGRSADCIDSETTNSPTDLGVASPRQRRFSFSFAATDTGVLCSGRYTARIRYVETICVFDVTGEAPDCHDGRSVLVGRRTFRVGTRYLPGCPHPGADTTRYAENAQAIVYDPDNNLDGCLKRSGHRYRLAAPLNPPDGYVEGVTLVGSLVAFGAWEGSACQRYGACPGFVPSVFVAVVDLRTGARREFPIPREDVNGYSAPVVHRAVVLTPNGSIAWIGCVDCRAAYRVYVADRAGQRLVDIGPGIDPDSLRRSGATVSWTSGGSPRSASLNE